jgi:hypothetical protein
MEFGSTDQQRREYDTSPCHSEERRRRRICFGSARSGATHRGHPEQKQILRAAQDDIFHIGFAKFCEHLLEV